MLSIKAACSLKIKSYTYTRIAPKHDKNKNTNWLKSKLIEKLVDFCFHNTLSRQLFATNINHSRQGVYLKNSFNI